MLPMRPSAPFRSRILTTMSPEQTQALYDAFPRLYRGRYLPRIESNMSFGFCCGDGWYELVFELSSVIVAHAAACDLDPIVHGVKDKFGDLRVHVEGGDDEIKRRVDEASARSRSTCSACGAPGEQAPGDDYGSPACPTHRRVP